MKQHPIDIPEAGTDISCSGAHISYLNSKVPAIRIKQIQGEWKVVDPAIKAGLIVFLTRKSSTFSAVRITQLRGNACFGDPIENANKGSSS